MKPHRCRLRRLSVEQLERRELLATLTVNSLLDSSPAGDGFVTLREAIAAANMDSTTDLGQTGSGTDTIEFAPELTTGGAATIELQGALTVTQPLTINGPGANLLTLEQQLAGPLNRILNISAASGDFDVNALTLTGGRTTGFGLLAAGGAIRSATSGHLVIRDSIITGNQTTGRDAEGGAVFARWNVTITRSVIRDNSTAGDRARGGGIFVAQPFFDQTILNSTVTENTVDDVLSAGGGVSSAGRLVLRNSIVAGNSAMGRRTDVSMHYVDASITADFTLIGNTSGFSPQQLAAIQSGTGNLLDQMPQLGPLADNGGSTTTHAPIPGSPTINAGDPAAVAGVGGIPLFDQRQAPFSRVSGGRLDMGDFEIQAAIVDGDFNDDGMWDCLDINALTAEIANVTHNPAFDLTGDQMVNLLDRDAWLTEAGDINLGPGLAYRLGDANLSGFVDGSDFSIWNANKFTQIAAWCSGDFNANGVVDGSDFNIWNSHKFTTSDNMAGPLGQAVLPISLRVASDPQSLRKPAGNRLLHAGRTDQPSWSTEVTRPKLPWHGPALQRHRTIRHNLVPLDAFLGHANRFRLDAFRFTCGTSY